MISDIDLQIAFFNTIPRLKSDLILCIDSCYCYSPYTQPHTVYLVVQLLVVFYQISQLSCLNSRKKNYLKITKLQFYKFSWHAQIIKKSVHLTVSCLLFRIMILMFQNSETKLTSSNHVFFE